MVKKWIIIISIILSLVVACTLEYNFVNSEFKTLEKKLEAYKPKLMADEENIDTEENINYITEIHDFWHEKNKVLKSLIWHTGLKDIEINMARIKSYVEENNFTEAITELEGLIYYVSHYSDDFKFSLENIL